MSRLHNYCKYESKWVTWASIDLVAEGKGIHFSVLGASKASWAGSHPELVESFRAIVYGALEKLYTRRSEYLVLLKKCK